jgi:hypothetical protein
VLWRELYESCVSETNPAELEKLVHEVGDAIYLRLRELSTESHLSDEVQELRTSSAKIARDKDRKVGLARPEKDGLNT